MKSSMWSLRFNSCEFLQLTLVEKINKQWASILTVAHLLTFFWLISETVGTHMPISLHVCPYKMIFTVFPEADQKKVLFSEEFSALSFRSSLWFCSHTNHSSQSQERAEAWLWWIVKLHNFWEWNWQNWRGQKRRVCVGISSLTSKGLLHAVMYTLHGS